MTIGETTRAQLMLMSDSTPEAPTHGARFPIGATVTIERLDRDPHPVNRRLRATEPVSWLPCLNGWLITRHDLALEAMRGAGTYTVDDPRFSTSQVIGPSMLSLDGAEHTAHRTPFVSPFRAAAVGTPGSAGGARTPDGHAPD